MYHRHTLLFMPTETTHSPPAAAHAHQFGDAAQQREAATLGMWVFLATEVLFFGAMFCGYTVYRTSFPAAFMEASQHTLIWFGTTNTAVLLFSSFMVVLAGRAAEEGQLRSASHYALITAGLGLLFLVFKGFEYASEIEEGLFPSSSFHIGDSPAPQGRLFFYFYFVMTGIHGLHVLIGVVLLTIFSWRLAKSATPPNSTAVELLGLYWHFVDIVWVFLFPLLYLVGRHG